MAQSKILVGLEIGTSKTCMVVGEIRPDATAAIIGIGEVPSAGIRKGEIADQGMARQCLCDAWQIAQDHADVDILNVFLSVTGEHIYGENCQGSYRLPDDEDIIEEASTRQGGGSSTTNPHISGHIRPARCGRKQVSYDTTQAIFGAYWSDIAIANDGGGR